MGHLYSAEAPNSTAQIKHKEEGERERKAETCLWWATVDWYRIVKTFPSTINQQWLFYNIVNGQVALEWGQCQECGIYWWEDDKWLPELPSVSIICQVKTMGQLKRCMNFCEKTPFDLETILLCLLIVIQKQSLVGGLKGSIPSPCVDTSLPAPQGLTDVINCGCKSEDDMQHWVL